MNHMNRDGGRGGGGRIFNDRNGGGGRGGGGAGAGELHIYCLHNVASCSISSSIRFKKWCCHTKIYAFPDTHIRLTGERRKPAGSMGMPMHSPEMDDDDDFDADGDINSVDYDPAAAAKRRLSKGGYGYDEIEGMNLTERPKGNCDFAVHGAFAKASCFLTKHDGIG